MAPLLGEAWGGMVQEHALTRSVRDCALLLDIADQPTPGEPYAAPHHRGTWLDAISRPPGKLRIAFTTDTLLAGQTSPECKAAVEDAAALLESLGHEVVEAAPVLPTADLVMAYFLTVAANTAVAVEDAARRAGASVRAADFEPPTWMLAQIGWATPAPRLVRFQQVMQQATRRMAAFFDTHDLFLTATLAGPPLPVGSFDLSAGERLQLALLRAVPLKALLEQALSTLGTEALAATPNTQLFNMTGQPAMSLPLFWSDAGLPIGVQFAARSGGEGTLLSLAAQLEQARGWADRLPPIVR